MSPNPKHQEKSPMTSCLGQHMPHTAQKGSTEQLVHNLTLDAEGVGENIPSRKGAVLDPGMYFSTVQPDRKACFLRLVLTAVI